MPLTLGQGLLKEFSTIIIDPNSPIPVYDTQRILAKLPLRVESSGNLISFNVSISWRKPTPFGITTSLRFNIYRDNISPQNLIYTTVDSQKSTPAFSGQTTSFIHVDLANNFTCRCSNSTDVLYFLTVELETP